MTEEKTKRNKEYIHIVKREYPNKSIREINSEFGIPKTTVARIAKENRLQHTEQTLKRLKLKVAYGRSLCIAKWQTEEAKQLISVKKKKLFRREYWRINGGLKQKTKLRLRKMPYRVYHAKWCLVRKRGYIETTEPYLLWYDEDTKRESKKYGETYYAQKYGLKFAPAEE